MTQRAKKKREKKVRREIHQVLDLVLDINGLQESQQDITGNHPTGFFSFSGHIALVTVDIHPYGWSAEDEPGTGYTSGRASVLRDGSLAALGKKITRNLRGSRRDHGTD